MASVTTTSSSAAARIASGEDFRRDRGRRRRRGPLYQREVLAEDRSPRNNEEARQSSAKEAREARRRRRRRPFSVVGVAASTTTAAASMMMTLLLLLVSSAGVGVVGFFVPGVRCDSSFRHGDGWGSPSDSYMEETHSATAAAAAAFLAPPTVIRRRRRAADSPEAARHRTMMIPSDGAFDSAAAQNDLFPSFSSGRGASRALPLSLTPSSLENSSLESECDISSLLLQHSLGDRLFRLSSSDLAFGDAVSLGGGSRTVAVAELYESGSWKPAIISGIRQGKKAGAAPRLEVVLVPDLSVGEDDEEDGSSAGDADAAAVERKTVGVSDATTLHRVPLPPPADVSIVTADDAARYIASVLADARVEYASAFPVRHVENALGRLCDDRTAKKGGGKTGAKGKGGKVISKKQIPKLAKGTSDPSRAEEILRTALKSHGKLVDSSDASHALYDGDAYGAVASEDDDGDDAALSSSSLRRLLVGAEALSRDAALGGRYKRMPCSYVSHEYGDGDESSGSSTGGDGGIPSVTVLNGGWMALEGQNRMGAEARKFAERAASGEVDKGDRGSTARGWAPATSADERIADRLEALAMGDDLPDDENDDDDEDQRVDVDVREALRALSLPVSPEGARDALLRMGRWSESEAPSSAAREGRSTAVEPWPAEVLEASRSLASYEADRRAQLMILSKAGGGGGGSGELEGRVDLTDLPSLCVDAPNTSFRDDALGLRTRTSAGQNVVEGAGKWELLVHIADLTDVFNPSDGGDCFAAAKEGRGYNAEALRKAAERRGYSRYDLPLGPLHLLPPVALKSLSLQTSNGNDSNDSDGDDAGGRDTVNRCVTVWAYIDERTGRLLDAGVERTLISAPLGLTYKGASRLLDGTVDVERLDPKVKTAKGMLSILDRILTPWSDRRAASDRDGAGRRRERMEAREVIARAEKGGTAGGGGESFHRTRAHRLVDAALDLYGSTASALLKRADVPVPLAPGSSRSGGRSGARTATAPLRRYLDGMAQRQVAAALCTGQSVKPPVLTLEECKEAGRAASRAEQRQRRENADRGGGNGKKKGGGRTSREREAALRSLAGHIASLNGRAGGGGGGAREKPTATTLPAVATGRENEVAILGASGISAVCRGVEGTLRTGQRVDVEVWDVDPERGRLSVRLARRGKKESRVRGR